MSYPEAAPASGDWPVLCDPLPEPQTPLGGQQLLPINAPPMQHPEVAPSSGDDPMLCDPPPESRASLGGQQLPSVNALPMPEADLPSEHRPIPSNSLPDPQVSASAHPAFVFTGGNLLEVQAASTMHLQDVLQMWYGFNYSMGLTTLSTPGQLLKRMPPLAPSQ